MQGSGESGLQSLMDKVDYVESHHHSYNICTLWFPEELETADITAFLQNLLFKDFSEKATNE